eukprot:TRINITY_DN22757_c0_g1_i1.p1 TRINITY_DN22757_c0_g1~~TRINITY_DN22757_c0_g1_i1.p1  ORF type:complete len:1758 (-),score=323.58 TRINITY_DN22757_c0_g1_i1:336-5531(-)
MVALSNRDRLLPELATGTRRSSIGVAESQTCMQAEHFANASARAHSSCRALRTVASDLGSALAQSASAISEWQRVAFAQAGTDDGASDGACSDAQKPWQHSVRGSQQLAAHLAALQAEAVDVTRWLAAVTGAHGELEVELARWLHKLPKESFSQRAVDILQATAPSAAPPLSDKAGPPLLRELAERHPHAVLRTGNAEMEPLPSLASESGGPRREAEQRALNTSARRAASEGLTSTHATMSSTRFSSSSDDKMTWACTAARLNGERLFQPRYGQKNRNASRFSKTATGANGFGLMRSGSDPRFTVDSQSPPGRSGGHSPQVRESTSDLSLLAELESTKVALEESKAEIALLRARFRDKAPPSTLRIGGPAPAANADAASKVGDVGGTGGSTDGALTCTRLQVPAAELALSKAAEHNEAEIRRLRYHNQELEKDLSRSHRFLAKGREELSEANKENEQLREDIRKLRVEKQEEADSRLAGRDSQELVRELKKRGFDFSALVPPRQEEKSVSSAPPSQPDNAPPPAPPPAAPPPVPPKPGSSDGEEDEEEVVKGAAPPGLSIVSTRMLVPPTPPEPTRSEPVVAVPAPKAAATRAAPKLSVEAAGQPQKRSLAVPAVANAPPTKSPLASARRGSTTRGSVVDLTVKRKTSEPASPAMQSKKRTGTELWNVARKFWSQLVDMASSNALASSNSNKLAVKTVPTIRAKGTSQVHVELSLAKLYKEHRNEFDDGDMGIFEFVGRQARMQEFNLQVLELVRGDDKKEARPTLVREVSTANLQALEKKMAAGYDRAFESAGGNARCAPRWAQVNEALQLLAQQRGEGSVAKPGFAKLGLLCQDAGFQLMGMDALYDTCRFTSDKLAREIERIATQTKGHADCAPLKGRPRARSKVLTKYGNNASLLTDVIRGSIAYPGIDELYDGFLEILEMELEHGRHDFYILEVNDRFQNSKDGYRDISMLINVDGVAGELQLHIQQIKDAKHGAGHDAYKKQRAVNESLFEACVRGNVTDILALANEYACCAAPVRDKHGRSALHYGCQVGSLRAVRALIRYHADPWCADGRGVLPFEVALRSPCGGSYRIRHLTTAYAKARGKLAAVHQCKNCDDPALEPYEHCGGATCKNPKRFPKEKTGHFDVANLVLAAMRSAPLDCVGQGPLRLVKSVLPWWVDHVVSLPPDDEMRSSWIHVGRELISMVSELNIKRKRQEESRAQKKISEVEWISHLNDWTLQAAARGQIARVSVLLEAGYNEVPAPGKPWLLDKAIQNGHTELAKMLIRCEFANARKASQCTLNKHLMYAARQDDAAYATAALVAKANPDAWDAHMEKKRTPLMSFAASGNLEMCKKLVSCRAMVDWADSFRCTAVHYARALAHDEVEQYLISVKPLKELPNPKARTIQYLCEAASKGCVGAVYRFVQANSQSQEETDADAAGGESDTDSETEKGGASKSLRSVQTSTISEDAISAGATVAELVSVKVKPFDYTPLHMAVWACAGKDAEGHELYYRSTFNVCRALIRANADPMAQTSKRDTPLHLAAQRGIVDLYDDLVDELSAAMDPDKLELLETKIQNNEEQVPYDLLNQNQRTRKVRGLFLDEERLEPTLLRTAFLAFDINRSTNQMANRLDKVRLNMATTWWDLLRNLRTEGNMPTKQAILHQMAIATPLGEASFGSRGALGLGLEPEEDSVMESSRATLFLTEASTRSARSTKRGQFAKATNKIINTNRMGLNSSSSQGILLC